MDEQLNNLLQQAVCSVDPSMLPQALRWEVPNDASFGDLSCPIAFKLASRQRRAPQQVAEQLANILQDVLSSSPLNGWVERLETKRGFVNLFLSHQALTQVLVRINHDRRRYGTSRLGHGKTILVEFVSANPTGPLSVAHGRQAAVGDALARMLKSQGYRVETGYYINDEGRQVELLGSSLRARYLQGLGREGTLPQDGYQGSYLIESANTCKNVYGERLLQAPESKFAGIAIDEMLTRIKHDLAHLDLKFTWWTSQRSLHTSGEVDAVLNRLRAQGVLYEHEGALWFASTKFGDDKDRVVRKQSGELTYLAPDIAYHHWKFQRGYDQLINLWGPDHHGYIPRLKAAMVALGLPVDRLVIRIVQLVTLSRQGKPIPMSKRQGEFVTFREVMDEVGVDAARFFYLMRTMDSHLDFDLDLAKAKVQENPVYYVQYAHARIWNILMYSRKQLPWMRRWRPQLSARLWRAVGPLGRRQVGGWGPSDLTRLVEPEERLLLRQLFQFPMMVSACAHALEPHGLTIYLQKLAELFHIFYTKHRVVSEDIPLSRARLALVRATRWVFANGLGLLGVSAPKRM